MYDGSGIDPSAAADELLLRRAARRDLLAFTVATHHSYAVGEPHRIITDALMAVERGEIDRLMIFAPPRHGKSELVSVRYPAWYLGRNDHKQLIATSYGHELARSFGRKVRNIVASPDYQRFFPGTTLMRDKKSANEWHTSNGGVYVASGIKGSIVGKGADCLIIDDPLRNRKEAESEIIRDTIWDIYESDLQSRLMPGGAIIVMHTRFHDDDLAGRLLENQKHGGDEWVVIKLQAIRTDKQGREHALWPERYPLEDMQRRRANSSARTWASIYQQEPIAEDGTFYKREWFRRFKMGDQPRFLNIYMTSDFAVTDDDGDFTEHAVWGVDPDGNLWALDWWYGQTASDVWIEKLIDLFAKHKPLAWFGEGGQIMRALEPVIVRRMQDRRVHCRVEWMAPVTDKPTRARGFQAMASMGKVHIPLISWGDRLISQLLRCWSGTYDDAADACSMMGMALDDAHPAIHGQQSGNNRGARRDSPPPPPNWKTV
jgi:predicted phage terminase large subunit-like protein